MEYAALNSGTHLQNGKLRKFVNADSGNKVIGVKVVGSKVQIIW
jgi:hypothetical protein